MRAFWLNYPASGKAGITPCLQSDIIGPGLGLFSVAFGPAGLHSALGPQI